MTLTHRWNCMRLHKNRQYQRLPKGKEDNKFDAHKFTNRFKWHQTITEHVIEIAENYKGIADGYIDQQCNIEVRTRK